MSALLGSIQMFGASLTPSFGSLLGTGSSATAYATPIMGAVVGLALIALIIYIIVLYGTARPKTTVLGPVDLFKPQSPVVVDRATTTAMMGGSYSLAFYLKMDGVPDMRMDAIPLMTWASVWNLGYNPAHEELVLTPVGAGTGAPGRVPGVPLQKWIQIVLTFEGRTMDFYINGQLVQAYSMQNVPSAPSPSSITLIPGAIIGKLAYVQVWNRRLRVAEVATNYTDTCDSQGRPYLGAEFVNALQNISIPNLFCPSGDCNGSTDGHNGPKATASQHWEFPYA